MSTKAPPLERRNRGGRGAVPLPAHDVQHPPEFARQDALPQRDQRGHEAPPIGDLERHPALGRDASRLLDLPPVQPGGLLAQDGYPGGERGAGDLRVPIGRSRHEDPVRALGSQQLRERAVNAISAVAQRLPGFIGRLDHVGDAHPARPTFRRVERPQVHASHPPRADQGELHNAVDHEGQDFRRRNSADGMTVR